ncbi:MAG: sortase domain-containing protein [Acidimicrobiales bacterium]
MAGSSRRTWIRWAIGSLVLIVLGAVLLIVGARGQDVGPGITGPIGSTGVTPGSSTTQSVAAGVVSVDLASFSTTSTRPVVALSGPTVTRPVAVTARVARHKPKAAVAFLGRSRPIHLMIPTLHLSVPLSVLGINHDGTVQVPTNFNEPGWYKFGPAPGQRGSAVILGHVDTFRGPAVFFYLRDLRPGNQIVVQLADHKVVHFAVLGLRMYTKGQFPERVVYGSRSYSALQLVTCGGVFDHATGHYLSNLVVFTKRVR